MHFFIFARLQPQKISVHVCAHASVKKEEVNEEEEMIN